MWWWSDQILKEVAKPRDLTTGIRIYVGGVSAKTEYLGFHFWNAI